MAKLLLLLRGAGSDDLVEALQVTLRVAFQAESEFVVQLLREPASDPFYDPAAALRRPQAVVDIQARAGCPLEKCYGALAQSLHGLSLAADSLALVMYSRHFIQALPQPLHYHLLMFRRKGTTSADYHDYYTRFHSRMGLNTPGIAGYLQNYIDAAASRVLARRLGLAAVEPDSISEMTFFSNDELMPQLAAAEVARAAPVDEARFVDRTRSLSFSSEVVLRLGDFERMDESVFEQHFCDPDSVS